MEEIRVYYEALEQANHLILPVIQSALDSLGIEVDVKLVKFKRGSEYYGKNIAPIVFWKDPDILVTAIDKNVEYPVFLIEFSTAVFTEDHELQRFDALVAAAKNNCVSIKISPLTKNSASKFGGNTQFDYLLLYALIYKKYNKPLFHFDWPNDENNRLLVHNKYNSIPQAVEGFDKIVTTGIEILARGYHVAWTEKLERVLTKESAFAEWFKKLHDTKPSDITKLQSSRTFWINNDVHTGDSALELKLNRFGHAMDPERGMIAYYGTDDTKLITKMRFDVSYLFCWEDVPGKGTSKLMSYVKRVHRFQWLDKSSITITKHGSRTITIDSKTSKNQLTIVLDCQNSTVLFSQNGIPLNDRFWLIKEAGRHYIYSDEPDAWYKDTAAESWIKNYIREKGLKRPFDFLYCFSLGSGLARNREFADIVQKYAENKDDPIIIDLTEFLARHYGKLTKALRTIFAYSKYFMIEDNKGIRRIILQWSDMSASIGYDSYPSVTKILKRDVLDEDDVTYISVHNILIPNGFEIVAVSYPGAQADRGIYVAGGAGRRQQRTYVDLIGYLPTEAINLQENKGVFSAREIKSDIDELSMFKTDPAYKEALRVFQLRYCPESINLNRVTGIGFWAYKDFSVEKMKGVQLKNLDYFFYITADRKYWMVWYAGDSKIFKKTKGDVQCPTTYSVVVTDVNGAN